MRTLGRRFSLAPLGRVPHVSPDQTIVYSAASASTCRSAIEPAAPAVPFNVIATKTARPAVASNRARCATRRNNSQPDCAATRRSPRAMRS